MTGKPLIIQSGTQCSRRINTVFWGYITSSEKIGLPVVRKNEVGTGPTTFIGVVFCPNFKIGSCHWSEKNSRPLILSDHIFRPLILSDQPCIWSDHTSWQKCLQLPFLTMDIFQSIPSFTAFYTHFMWKIQYTTENILSLKAPKGQPNLTLPNLT